MKKLTLYLLPAIFFIMLVVIIGGMVKKTSERTMAEKFIESFPAFSLPSLTGAVFTSESLEQGPVLVLIYHPECEHCRYELSEITKSNLASNFFKLLLIAHADSSDIQNLLENFDFQCDQKVLPLIDTSGSVVKLFGANLIPSCYIYDKHLKLVKALHGEYKVESINNYMQVSEKN